MLVYFLIQASLAHIRFKFCQLFQLLVKTDEFLVAFLQHRLERTLAPFIQTNGPAAYNAGPLSVEAWLPDANQLDARIWIENIPYNETRSYVRRVLTASAIFHWRLTGEVRRLSSELSTIDPPAESVAGLE